MNLGRGKTGGLAARAAAITLVAGGLAAIYIAPASADQFQQGNNAPTVSVDGTTPGEQALVFNPLYAGSNYQNLNITVTDVDTVTNTAASAGGKNDIANVKVCLTATGATDCVGTLDPQKQMLLTLTDPGTASVASSAVFTSDNGGTTGAISAYGAGNSNTGAGDSFTSDITGSVLSVKFRFNVSRVFTETQATPATSWQVRSVTATDDLGSTSTATDLTDASVTATHFSSITSQRVAQNFGTLSNGTSANANDISAGTIVTNGGSDITYRLATNFYSNGPNSTDNTATGDDVILTNAGSTPATAPTMGQFSYDCTPAATYPVDNSGATRVPTVSNGAAAAETGADSLTGAVDIEPVVNTTGTVEAGVAAAGQSCKLTNGGNTESAGTTFRAVVVTGTTADAIA
jgi:hypothetical protein